MGLGEDDWLEGDIAMTGRFPNVDWYCDQCNEHLNPQPGFDDSRYIWKCTNCGYKSSISFDNITNFREAFFGSDGD
jgi:transposase-like protein